MIKIKIFKMHSGELIIGEFNKQIDQQFYTLTKPMEIILRRYSDSASAMILTPWLPFELVDSEVIEISEDNFQYAIEPAKKLIQIYHKVKDLYSEVVSECKELFDKKLDLLLTTSDFSSIASSMEEELETIQDELQSLKGQHS